VQASRSGVVLYLLSLIGTRTVTVQGSRRLGVSLKLLAAALIGALLAAESGLPPVAAVGALAAVLVAVVYVEHTRLSSSM
jgi:hypothetical protein